eukprot:SAG22_NODE_166_length_16765_cov_30.782791_6_plen_207_part_00
MPAERALQLCHVGSTRQVLPVPVPPPSSPSPAAAAPASDADECTAGPDECPAAANAAAGQEFYVPAGSQPALAANNSLRSTTCRSTHPGSLYVVWSLITPQPTLLLESGTQITEKAFNTRFFAKDKRGASYFGEAFRNTRYYVGEDKKVHKDIDQSTKKYGGYVFNPRNRPADEQILRARLAVLVEEVRAVVDLRHTGSPLCTADS